MIVASRQELVCFLTDPPDSLVFVQPLAHTFECEASVLHLPLYLHLKEDQVLNLGTFFENLFNSRNFFRSASISAQAPESSECNAPERVRVG